VFYSALLLLLRRVVEKQLEAVKDVNEANNLSKGFKENIEHFSTANARPKRPCMLYTQEPFGKHPGQPPFKH
jgi:hypothetical protein